MTLRPVSLDARRARHRFLILRATRWFPTGLLIPVLVLFMVDRGLTLAQIGIASAAQGVMVIALELPTGGLADAFGRRRVLLAANGFDVLTLALYLLGGSLVWFVIAWGFQGVFRALESGPLDAWYVDAVHEAGASETVERGLSLGGVVLGLAIASGALASGALVWIGDRAGDVDPLVLPFVVALGLRVLDTVLIWRLMNEVRPDAALAHLRRSLREVPEVVAGAITLVRGSVVLAFLVSVELTWGFGMAAFEVLFPARLADTLDSADRAASLMGPVAAVAWVASSGGAALVPRATERFGKFRVAAAMRLLQAATILAMGVVAGPVGAITAYLANYLVHGASNPVHLTLVHEQAAAHNRATVVSLNSMMAGLSATIGGIVLGTIADRSGISTGMYVGALVLAFGSALYALAGRAAVDADEPAVESVA